VPGLLKLVAGGLVLEGRRSPCREFFRAAGRPFSARSAYVIRAARRAERGLHTTRVASGRAGDLFVWNPRRSAAYKMDPPKMTTMQQRKEEILAKRAKLAELKRQRELRQKEFNQSRQSISDSSEVRSPFRDPFAVYPLFLTHRCPDCLSCAASSLYQ